MDLVANVNIIDTPAVNQRDQSLNVVVCSAFYPAGCLFV